MRTRFSRHALALSVALAGLGLSVQARAQDATMEKVLDALPELAEVAERTVDSGLVPGLAIAVVYQDKVVYLKGFGVREMAKDAPVDADTVFQLASASKPISSTVVAALVGDGAVSWDSRIADIDPGFQLYEAYPTVQLTVRDLFAHRSGLPGNAGNELESLGYDRNEILRRLRYIKPASSFRSAYSYSNFGLTEGGVAAAKAAEMDWEEAAEKKLFEPLGMKSTSGRHADFLKHKNRAELHQKVNGKWVAEIKRDPDPQSPAGGISSTARDLTNWMRLELAKGKFDGQQLIKEEAIEQTHLPVMARGRNPVSGEPAFYGLGWALEFGRHGPVWEHAGAFSVGARTYVSLLPDEQLGIVVLSNAFPTGVPDGIADTFFDLVFEGKATRDWIAPWNEIYDSLFGPAIEASNATYGKPPASPAPALDLSAYAGSYANEYLGEASVVEKDGKLSVRLGPEGKISLPLKHFDRDLFIYYPIPEMAEVAAAVTFTIGPDGKAQQVTIEDLNDLGQGVLTRVKE